MNQRYVLTHLIGVWGLTFGQRAIDRLKSYASPTTVWPTMPISRKAAVLILLFADEKGELRVVITMRSSTLSSYSGQAALPGGKAEPGETAFEAARRETSEEIGLLGGQRPCHRHFASNIFVRCRLTSPKPNLWFGPAWPSCILMTLKLGWMPAWRRNYYLDLMPEKSPLFSQLPLRTSCTRKICPTSKIFRENQVTGIKGCGLIGTRVGGGCTISLFLSPTRSSPSPRRTKTRKLQQVIWTN